MIYGGRGGFELVKFDALGITRFWLEVEIKKYNIWILNLSSKKSAKVFGFFEVISFKN